MIKKEIVIDEWNASYFDNFYSEDNDIREKTINRKKQISLDTFIDNMDNPRKLSNLSYEILPLNCRFSMDIDGYKLFVIEEAPQMRTMFLDYDMSMDVEKLKASGELKKFGYENWFNENNKPYKFYLAFPYIIYIIVLNQHNSHAQTKIFTRVTPLSSFEDYMCKIPLMNINNNQSICMGSFTDRISKKTPTSAINRVISQFWKNIFNIDYIYNVKAYENIPFVCDYLTWQYYSQKDPMFIYNVEWIPYKRNFGWEIDNAKKEFKRGFPEYSMQALVDKVFYKPSITHKKVNDLSIYDNVADSINIDGMPIFVNDSFMLKDKRYFVMSFMSPIDNLLLTHIKLRDPDKKIIEFKLTKLFKNKLKECIMRERFIQQTTLSNGQIIKQGSIIKYIGKFGTEIYNKVIYMRYGLDGKIEARIKSTLVALEDLKGVKILDMENIKVNDIKIEVGKQYSLLFNYSYFYKNCIAPVKVIKKLLLTDIDINTTGTITTQFIDNNDGKKYLSNLPDLKEKIINKKKLIKKSSICRLGTSIISNTSIKTQPDIIDDLIIDDLLINTPSFNKTIDVVLKDKQHLFIESFDMDLSFKVGDKVVTSNWENPVEMLIVKTIMGFKTQNKSLNVLLEDQHGNKTEHTYLYKNRSNFIVNVGTLRHIVQEYNGVTSGTKIKAKKSKITNFPMNATNIIIGFLSDTGGDIPLVLCSNGATLWADDLLENFNLITITNKKWKSLKHVPIINQSRFKFQSGDVTTIPYHENKYAQNLITIQYIDDRLVCHYLNNKSALFPKFNGYFISELKSIVNRIGFISPRYSQKQLEEQSFVKAYPNFHGMYTINPNLKMRYYVDERRILNVSSLPV